MRRNRCPPHAKRPCLRALGLGTRKKFQNWSRRPGNAGLASHCLLRPGYAERFRRGHRRLEVLRRGAGRNAQSEPYHAESGKHAHQSTCLRTPIAHGKPVAVASPAAQRSGFSMSESFLGRTTAACPAKIR